VILPCDTLRSKSAYRAIFSGIGRVGTGFAENCS
jgi:hypothetical protein